MLNISAYKWRDWYPEVSQMARTTPDVGARVNSKWSTGATFELRNETLKKEGGYYSVMDIAEENNKWAKFTGRGYWNDPDMLVSGEQGLTFEQQKSHFALYCIMSSPLMLGNNPLDMAKEEKQIIFNKTAIMVDQDPSGQGKLIKGNNEAEVWAKKLNGGKTAVLLLNKNNIIPVDIELKISYFGLEGEYMVKDIFKEKDLDNISGAKSYSIPQGSSLFVLLSKR